MHDVPDRCCIYIIHALPALSPPFVYRTGQSRTKRSSSRTPKPTGPLGTVGVASDDSARLAMSRCAHGVAGSAKKPMKAAPRLAPGLVPSVEFLMSAMSDF